MSTPRLQIHLLGPFRLLQDNRPVAGFDQARLQHLLAYLVLHPAVPISRPQLAFVFWPETTDQQALKNLPTLLTRLRRALPDADRYIEVTAQIICWRPGADVAADTADFQNAVAASQGRGGAASALAHAVAAYGGELLPDCHDDWIVPLREQFRDACRDTLERLILILEEQREYSRALGYARRLLQHDPLHEAAYDHLMRLHAALGDRSEVLRVYRACETMLAQEFGTAPARSMRDLYERVRERDERAPMPGVEPQPGSGAALPLVGRNEEWARLVAAWHAAAAGHAQLILLTGEAGIGKTRLAEELCGWAARQGATVAAAHCYPEGAGASSAYGPVAEWLRGGALRPRVTGLDDVWLAEIARIVPAILAERPPLAAPGPLTEAWQRTRLFEALARGVLGSAPAGGARRPLLLFLDDLQWCDQETLDWLGFLLRFATAAPLLLVGTARKYEVDRLHPLMAFWLGLTRLGLLEEILLAPLDASETGRLAANVAGRAIDGPEASEIYHDTEGNPLFVVETVRAEMANAQTGRTGDRNRYVERGSRFAVQLHLVSMVN